MLPGDATQRHTDSMQKAGSDWGGGERTQCCTEGTQAHGITIIINTVRFRSTDASSWYVEIMRG